MDPSPRHLETGRLGEATAVAHLEAAGYLIAERNYRCPFGEIDIVARQGDTLVFVEVKSRRSLRFGDPQAAVGPAKQRKISRIALCYLQERRIPPDTSARFDVVAVSLTVGAPRIEHIENAFDLVSS